MKDHGSQVRAEFIERQSFGNVSHDPLQIRLAFDVDTFDINLDRHRATVLHFGFRFVPNGLTQLKLPQVIRQPLLVGLMQAQHRAAQDGRAGVAEKSLCAVIGVGDAAIKITDQNGVDAVFEQACVSQSRGLRLCKQLRMRNGCAGQPRDAPQQLQVERRKFVAAGVDRLQHTNDAALNRYRDGGDGSRLETRLFIGAGIKTFVGLDVRDDNWLVVFRHPACDALALLKFQADDFFRRPAQGVAKFQLTGLRIDQGQRGPLAVQRAGGL